MKIMLCIKMPCIALVQTVLFAGILFSSSLTCTAQCFDDCLTRMAESKSPFAHLDILSQLAGCQAPEFVINTVDNEKLSLSALHGNIVVLNFWYIGCAPCREEIPILNKLTEDYANNKITFIAFNPVDSENEIRQKFMSKVLFKYKLASAPGMAKTFCVIPFPSHVVIDQTGKIKTAFFGPLTSNEYFAKLKSSIDDLLGR